MSSVTGSDGKGSIVPRLQAQMTQEFRQLDSTPRQHNYANYLVYKSVFSEIIEHATVFKPVLTEIQTAYDTEITKLYNSHVSDKFSKATEEELTEATETITTLESRKAQLQNTLTKLQVEKLSLTASIQSMRSLVADISAQSLLVEEDIFKNTIIDNMTLEQMTNINLLSRELGKLQNHHQHMLEVQSMEFSPREKFEDARTLLLKKEDKKEELQNKIVLLHKREPSMKQLVETLQKFEGTNSTFEQILAAAQKCTETSQSQRSQTFELYDDEDPAKEREAEMALAYVEHLEELIRDNNFTAAAIHAANSPKGFLRTMSTIEEFKWLSNEGSSPLLQYCITLMNTISQFSKPPEDQSYECVQCALKENRTDCVAQWIANDNLTLSRAIADLLLCNCHCRARCDCESGTLAQAVYRNVEDHDMLIYCLARQGALYRAVHYSKKHNIGQVKLLNLLKNLPSVDLAAILVLEEGLNIGDILQCLMDGNHDSVFIGLLRMLSDTNDLKDSLLVDTSGPDIHWSEFVEVCAELGEQGISEELQGFIISREAMHKAVDSLSTIESREDENKS